VVEARWNEEKGIWTIKVEDTTSREVIEDWSHFMITGSGILKSVSITSVYINRLLMLRLVTGDGRIFQVYIRSRESSSTAPPGIRTRTGKERLLPSWAVDHLECRLCLPFNPVSDPTLKKIDPIN
jgi:hypothetical protein